MTRRLGVPVLVVVLFASGCGAGGRGATRDERLVRSALARLDRAPKTFVYAEEIEGQALVVRGREQDDLRYEATVAIDGVEVYRHLVADDAAAIQLLAAEAGDPVVIAATASDGVAGEALKERKWVMDPVGAPPILTAGSPEERASRVGLNPLIDAVSIPTYAAQAVTEAVTIGLWNPEGIDYNPLDDPWRDDVDANLGAQGLRRFDIVQPPLPVGLQAGRSVTPPGPGHFRKMAFYLQGDRIVEIREQISFIDRREYRRAQEGQAPMANIEVIEAAMEGFTDEPVRERRLTYTVEYQDVSVDIPPDAVAGSIGPALGVSGIGAMLVPPPQPGVGPAGVPIPTPGSDDEPEQDELSDTES